MFYSYSLFLLLLFLLASNGLLLKDGESVKPLLLPLPLLVQSHPQKKKQKEKEKEEMRTTRLLLQVR
jgi:hypothetical protein